ncbi:DNA-processing protein DprA [Rhodoferax sp. PAMC 29310]|uniref:DNA-processing protein DprA n=1 Tax=Rhodoferax sp. PAMC 29310 TaxID=2822760 RepID=UPI001B335711|nr:DNA-processing protein DprA [Rhodoferax sp. PAMC 29310]
MDRDELGGWLRLSLTRGVGNDSARKLLAAFGLPASIFGQPLAALQQAVSTAQSNALREEPVELAPLLETTWTWLNDRSRGAPRRQIVVLGDSDYPPSLLTMEDPPLMLYLLGAGFFGSNSALPEEGPAQATTKSIANMLSDRALLSLAMVGSRNPTPQGAANARQFAKAFAQAGLTVVSGLALGIDGAAHEGALDGHASNSPDLATVAVVGTGLDRVYPKAHRDLAHRIAQHGVLLSEYPLGTPPLTANFPKRNRLIAGLSQGTLVVEAAMKSGSLITARLTVEQGKEVFAIPGSIHSTQSRGCHSLIKQGAKLVESAMDVLEEMKLDPSQGTNRPRQADDDDTDIDAPSGTNTPLLKGLGFDPVSLDALQARTGLDTASLQAELMTLELDGLVTRLPGGLFQRLITA